MSNLFELLQAMGSNLPVLSGKMKLLIDGINSGKFKTKEQVIKKLFAQALDPHQSFNKLKLRTEKILTYHILTSNVSETAIQKVYNECHADYARAMILIGKGYNKSGIQIARRCFNSACEYEFIHIASALAERLTEYYSEVMPQRRLQRRYLKAAKKYVQQIQINSIATAYYSDTIINLNQKSNYTKGIIKKLKLYSQELSKIENPTVKVKFHTEVLKIFFNFAQKNYEMAALISTKTLKYLDSKPQVFSSYKASLILYLSIAAVASKQYRLAEKSLQNALELIKGPYNWQVLTYYRAINALHARNYSQAFQLHRKAHQRRPSGYIAEQWTIFRAYLFLFSQAGQLQVKYARFGIGKFLNETVRASQDKAGYNINIIIAELLVYLYQDRARFIDRIDSVRTYTYRHLKGEDTARARFFLRVLFRLTSCDFKLERVLKATAQYRRRLHERVLNAKHNLEIEIVPFEHLLEVLDASLDKAPERRRSLLG